MSSIIRLFNVCKVGTLVSPCNFEPTAQRYLGEISKRYTIGDRCKKCKKLSAKGIQQAAAIQEKLDPPKPKPCPLKKSFGCNTKAPCTKEFRKVPELTCISEKCIPFRDCPPKKCGDYIPVLKKCRAKMLNPYEAPPVGPQCYLTKGKMGFTTNERVKKELPPCPKGDWRYTDAYN